MFTWYMGKLINWGFVEGKEEQIKYHLVILVISYANGHETPCMEGKGEPLCG